MVVKEVNPPPLLRVLTHIWCYSSISDISMVRMVREDQNSRNIHLACLESNKGVFVKASWNSLRGNSCVMCIDCGVAEDSFRLIINEEALFC